MIVICDIDGTIADNSRREYLSPKPGQDNLCEQWDKFNLACGSDRIIIPVMNVIESLALNGHAILFWTGRSEICRPQTEQWLSQSYSGLFAELRMRPRGCHIADHDLKRQWFFDSCASYNGPKVVFEDRSSVVKMWRSIGVTCLQVADGDF